MSFSIFYDIFARDHSARGFNSAANNADRTGKKFSKLGALGRGVGAAGAVMAKGLVVGGAAAVAVGTKAFNAFADFDKTIRQVGVQTGQTGKGLKQMSDLALQLGKDTSFSAGEASQAMLELAKGGMTAAQIKGGALKQTLTLAAAGGLELGSAATFMVNTLGAFGLKAQDAASVAAALAGGANASTASVESMGQALSQVGAGAKQAGMSVHETVAALAAFDQAGIKGSDAGTSLKTMLQRLAPQTDKARTAMKDLGIDFTKSNGSFKSMSQVAQILQTRLGGLSAAERTTALNTIFGSDASRAAAVLMENGAKGVQKYIKATKDRGAAEKLAKTNTQGAAGAIEQMTGSLDTLMIVGGKAIAPLVTAGAKGLTQLINMATTGVQKLGPIMQPVKQFFASFSSGSRNSSSAMATFKQAIATVAPIAKQLGTGLITIFRQLFTTVRPIVMQIGQTLIRVFRENAPQIKSALNSIKSIIVTALAVIRQAWARIGPFILPIVRTVFGTVVKVVGGLLKAVAGVVKTVLAVIKGDWRGAWNGIKQIFSGVWNAITALLSGAWNLIKQLISGGLAAVKGVIGRVLGGIKALWNTAWNALLNLLRNIWNGIKNAVSKGVSNVMSFVKSLPGKIKGAFSGAVNWLVNAGADIIRGLISGIKSMARSAADAAINVVESAVAGAKHALGISSPSKVFAKIGKQTMQGLVKGLKGSTNRVRNALEKLVDKVKRSFEKAFGDKLGRGKFKQFFARIDEEVASLKRNVKAREQIAKRLERAQDKLKAALDRRNEFAKSISESVRQFGSILNVQAPESGTLTGAQIAEGMQLQLNRARAFMSTLDKLRKMGLNKRTLRELLEAGPEQAGAMAAALAQGGKAAIGQVNKIQAALKSQAKAFGMRTGKHFYQSGVDAARGLVRGLVSRERELAKVGRRLAKAIIKELRRALKIKSPSQVMADQIGRPMADGIVKGILTGRQSVAGAVSGLTAGSMPGIAVGEPHPRGGLGKFGGSGQVVIELHNHAPIGSPRELENWLAAAVDSLARKGKLPRQIVTRTA